MWTTSRYVACVTCTVVLVLGQLVRADTVNLTPVKDNSIYSTDPETSNGQGDLFCGTTGGGVTQRSLLAFDVAGSVPAGSTITSASLTLTLIRGSGESGPQEVELHPLLNDWGEGTSIATGGGGAPPTTDDATWSFRFFPDEDRMWDVAGGDFDDALTGSATVGTDPGPFSWDSTPQAVADVQGWLDDPDSSFGWILLGNEAQGNTARRFASRETETATNRPTLTIDFEPAPTDGGGGAGMRPCGWGIAGIQLFCLVTLIGMRRRDVPGAK